MAAAVGTRWHTVDSLGPDVSLMFFASVCVVALLAAVLAWRRGRAGLLNGELRFRTTFTTRRLDVARSRRALVVPLRESIPGAKCLVILDEQGRSVMRVRADDLMWGRTPLHSLVLHAGIPVTHEASPVLVRDLNRAYPWASDVPRRHRIVT